MNTANRTIAAVSTPRGKGGVALLRISGDEAISIASDCFAPAKGGFLSDIPSNTAVYGRIHEGADIIDDGIATVFRAPRSYTGEDVVEISCHGGVLVTQRILEALFAAGAYGAQPGEFTRRAFTAGKITLTQAEAVAEILEAKTEAQLRLANGAAGGKLRQATEELYGKIKKLVASFFAVIDFPDEDLAELSAEDAEKEMSGMLISLKELKASYSAMRPVIEGVDTVICGRPNTGKSSLYNAIARQDLAIVTDVAGTTRDTLSTQVSLGNVLLKLKDTAGIRNAENTIEKIGVERSLAAIEEAELVIAVFDGSEPLTRPDLMLCEKIRCSGKSTIAVINKSDLPQKLQKAALETFFRNIIALSSLTGDGIKDLTEAVEKLYCGDMTFNDAAVLNARQYACVAKAESAVSQALYASKQNHGADAVGYELECALAALGELDGREVCEEVVAEIFLRFCIGK